MGEPTPQDLPNYDPSAPARDILGRPAMAMRDWHYQVLTGTCAIVVQQYILQRLGGRGLTETELVAQAAARGWYRPDSGTEMEDVGKLLELHGVSVVRQQAGTLAELEALLAAGRRIIVGVDADEIWWRGPDRVDEDLVHDPPGPAGRDANHAVEVIGLDRTNPDEPLLILNDPGHPDGRGLLVAADRFVDAWSDSGYFVVFTLG